MNKDINEKKLIKFSYIEGLENLVMDNISNLGVFCNAYESNGYVYVDYHKDLAAIRDLSMVSRAYLVLQDSLYNPRYISRHKSILGTIIQEVFISNTDKFKTFSISAAGADSPEVQAIVAYTKEEFNIEESQEPDLKIHFAKYKDTWEIGVQMTIRPLSLRSHKTHHIPGAMDPTIASALNQLCGVNQYRTYMNPFSGSGTLLIEAALRYQNLDMLIGFDNNKKTLSLSVQNIKSAKLISRVKVTYGDIFDPPSFGGFDVIVADLPFGMQISKGEELDVLYEKFLDYCDQKLNEGGTVGVYTPKIEIIERLIQSSCFLIEFRLPLKMVTSVNSYLLPVLYTLKRKQ